MAAKVTNTSKKLPKLGISGGWRQSVCSCRLGKGLVEDEVIEEGPELIPKINTKILNKKSKKK